jgi:hypothetical protein
MLDRNFQFKIDDLWGGNFLSNEEKEKIKGNISLWDLTKEEEFLLTRLLTPDPAKGKEIFVAYAHFLTGLRGEVSEDIKWDSLQDVLNISLDKERLVDEGFVYSILFCLSLWHPTGSLATARAFIEKIEEKTGGFFYFYDLPDKINSLYEQIVLILMVDYFEDLPREWHIALINGPMLYDAITTGLDVEDAISRTISTSFTVQIRRDLSVNYATMLYTNPMKFGNDIENEDEKITIKSVIEKFRLYSNKRFDSVSLMNFLDDKKNWVNLDKTEKAFLGHILSLYIRLISDGYVFPEEEDVLKKTNDINKIILSTIKQRIDDEFEKDNENDYLDIEGVLRKLKDFSEHYNIEQIEYLLYFDEASGKFKWKE